MNKSNLSENALLKASVARVTSKHLDYSPILHRLELSVADVTETGEPVGKACTNGKRLFVSPQFIRDFTSDELDSLLIHEVNHIAREHPRILHEVAKQIIGSDYKQIVHKNREAASTYTKIKMCMNIAGDLAINGDLVEHNEITPDFIERSGGLYDPTMKGKTTLEIFEEIWRQLQNEMSDSSSEQKKGGCSKLNSNDSSQQKEKSQQQGDSDTKSEEGDGEGDGGEVEGGSEGQDSATLPEHDKRTEYNDFEPSPNDEAADELTKLNIEAETLGRMAQAAIYAGSQSQGSDVGNFCRLKEKKSFEDWSMILRAYIESHGGRVDYTYRRPSSLSRVCGAYYPSLGGGVPKRVVIAVDTSGSMSDNEISLILGKLQNLLSVFPEIEAHVTFFSSHAQEPVPLRNWKNHVSLERGGTNFHSPMDIAKRLRAKVLIMCTDGEAAIPPKPNGMHVVWLLSRPSNYFNEREAYGKIIRMRSEHSYWEGQ